MPISRNSFVIVLFFIIAAFLTVVQVPAQDDEAAQIAVLQKLNLSEATDAELFNAVTACQRLTVTGTEKSVSVLKPLLADARLASYARTALQNIGGSIADTALKENPAKAENNSPDSKNRQKAVAATQAVLENTEKSLILFSELLKSDDKTSFNAALAAFRKFPDRKIVEILAQDQSSLKPERRIAAILSLLDRKDVAPVPQPIIEAAKNDADPEIQAAAMTVLGAFPDDELIRFLFKAAADNKAAFEALATTRYPEIDKIILEYLAGSDPNIRMTANQLSGERHLTTAEPLLWTASKDSNWGGVQLTAFIALGRIVNKDGFAKLLDAYLMKENENVKPFILAGIKTASQLASDKTAYSKLIIAQLPESVSLQLELLALVGGAESLQWIVETAKTTEQDNIRGEATKYLGEWTGAEVAPVLLDLSVSLKEEKYKVRTFRGFLRAVRQFDMPQEEKRKLCEKAVNLAPRDEEKKLVQDVLSKL